MIDGLIDDIYEAGLIPNRWPEVLSRLCSLTQDRAGGLVAIDSDYRVRGLPTESYRDTYDAFVRTGMKYRNIRAERAMMRNHAGFLRDIDLCSLEELAVDEIYQCCLHPFGLGWTIGTFVRSSTPDVIIFDFARKIEDGPHGEAAITLLDELRPHLARAAFLSARLGLVQAENATAALGTIGLPAAVIGRDGTPIAANADFATHAARVEPHLRGVVPITSIPDVLRPEGGWRLTIPLPAKTNAPALVVHRLPIRGNALDLFTGAIDLVVVVPVGCPEAPEAGILSGLFDLTPAETRVARAVCAGSTIEDCARAAGVSPETIRSQLKSVLAKTGTRRQIDLVRLLSSLVRGAQSTGISVE